MKISHHAYDAYKCKNSWEKKDKEEFMPIRTVKQHLHLNVTPMTFLRTLATWNSQESHVQMRPIVCLELSFLVITFIQSNSITLARSIYNRVDFAVDNLCKAEICQKNSSHVFKIIAGLDFLNEPDFIG